VPDDDEFDRRMRKLSVEHAETRWLALRLDDDVKEVRGDLRAVRDVQREHTARFDGIDNRFDGIDNRLDEHSRQFQEHSARFDGIDAQLRSLTQLVGQVLQRLPDKPKS
jgi:archaellum component FlaC